VLVSFPPATLFVSSYWDNGSRDGGLAPSIEPLAENHRTSDETIRALVEIHLAGTSLDPVNLWKANSYEKLDYL